MHCISGVPEGLAVANNGRRHDYGCRMTWWQSKLHQHGPVATSVKRALG